LGDPVTLGVDGSEVKEGIAPVATKGGSSYFSVWSGSYKDLAPAQRAVSSLQARGLTAFTVKKTLADRKLGILERPVGDFYLALAGLFGKKADAEVLGKRLKAQGLITNWEVVPSDSPGELSLHRTQTAPLERRSETVSQNVQERAGRPLPSDSPVVTGEAFKKVVRGRYVGSYRDFEEARGEARRLTTSGWPAAVEETRDGGGMWYRVYLAETKDTREFKAPAATFDEARASAASQKGIVILIDSSGLKGTWGNTRPNAKRTDASSCEGYSQAGRLFTSVERLVSYIPDTGILVAIKPLAYNPASGLDIITRPVKSLVTGDDSPYSKTDAAYGPVLFNRPEAVKSLRRLKVDDRRASVAPGIANLHELDAIPGRKIVVLFSDFKEANKPDEIQGALGRVKASYGSGLDFIVVYGDTDDRGLSIAENLARFGGGSGAFDGCQLLYDNSYFERFVKTVFRR
jgi:hypothetical protein